MSRPHHGPPRRRARVEPERDEVGGAGDDARAIRMTQRERGDYFGLGARRRLDDAGEVYGIGRGIVSRTDGIDGARARTAAAAYHRDGPFQNLRVDGAADRAVRARQRARQRRLERAPRVRAVAGLDGHTPALSSFVCGFVCVFTRRRRVRNRRSVSNGTRGVGGAEKKEWLDRESARSTRRRARKDRRAGFVDAQRDAEVQVLASQIERALRHGERLERRLRAARTGRARRHPQ